MSLMQVVLVNFQYEYTTRDGRHVSIKPNERYVLVAKTNDHWWYVCKDEATKPFFLPARYVTVLPSENETTHLSNEQNGQDTPQQYFNTVPLVSLEATIKEQKSKSPNGMDEHRISKTVVLSDQDNSIFFKNEPWEGKADPIQTDISQDGLTNYSSPIKGESTNALSQPLISPSNLQRTATEPSEIQLNKNPNNDLNDDIQMLIRAGWDPKIWDLKKECMNESLDLVKHSVVLDTKDNERKVEEELALVFPVSPSSTSPTFSSQHSPGSPHEISCAFTEKVQSLFLY